MVNPKIKTKKRVQQQRTPTQITVTVTKTVQLKKFHPVGITITEVHDLTGDDEVRETRNQVIRQVSSAVNSYLDRKVEEFKAEYGDDEEED